MADYTILLSKKAERALDKLSNHTAAPIFKAILALKENHKPVGYKKLKGRDGFRVRVGNYRIIYSILKKELIIHVLALGHRKDIYKA